MTKHSYIRALALALALSTIACGPLGGGPVAWPKVAQCAPGIDDLLPTVTELVMDQGQPGEQFTDRALTGLEDLAREHGPDAVACLVKSVVDAFLAQDTDRMAAGYKPDPASAAAAKRGEAFLAARGVQEVQP